MLLSLLLLFKPAERETRRAPRGILARHEDRKKKKKKKKANISCRSSAKPVVEFHVVRQSVNIAPRRLPRPPKTIPRKRERPTWFRETSQRPPRSGQKSAGGPQEAPKSTQEEPKMVPWPPRSPQEIPKDTPEELRRPPRDPQERPKEAQERPKTLSRPSSDRKRRFFTNRAPAEAKSWFLRVRGSAWEVKIDPKRVEKEYKHVLEEDMS